MNVTRPARGGALTLRYAHAARWAARGSALSLALSAAFGCARAPASPSNVTASSASAPGGQELVRLQSELAERERTIAQLQSKLALLETSARQRSREQSEALAAVAVAPSPPASAPRVTAAAPLSQAGALPEPAAARESGPRPVLRLTGDSDEPRPVLRLVGENEPSSSAPRTDRSAHELVSSWQPPVTSERLSLAPVPALPVQKLDREQAEALYVQALDLVRKREFAAALRELDAFLGAFPRDVRSLRAQFWRGEVLFALREYGRALSAFQEVLERDPSGDKAADALLRVARCQLRLGAPERARSTIAELRGRFPNSEAARAALGLEEDS